MKKPSPDDLPNLSGDDITRLDPVPGMCGMVGEYRLLQKIGEGGMGAVFMAQQSSPIQRKVALKIIKGHANSKQIIARFEAERQALAMMEHPNIARILGAGEAEDGSPYFVMELVKGIPITEYCDQNRLSITERLELFVSVCRAVQHAHLKGIIHRDLKPSNVLVALYDGVPVPKVIDFGLAKAINQQLSLTDKTLFTEYGQVIGTLQYMSPEQAEMNQLDVDTRTDIYSLGVILFELLTGSTPLDRDTIRANAVLKVLDQIRESDPPRPSLRLTKAGESQAKISEQRRLNPLELHRMLTRELDWVVIKSLARERNRRYETVNEFANDILRYLDDENVTARPPTLGYRFKKYLRRNKLLVSSAAIISTLLVVGTVLSATLAIRAFRAEADATTQAQAAEANAADARSAAKHAKDILQFVTSSFGAADPMRGEKKDIKAADVLRFAMESAPQQISDKQALADVYMTLASAMHGVGDEAAAIRSALAAKAIHDEVGNFKKSIAANNLVAASLLARGDGYRAWEICSQSVALLLTAESDTIGSEAEVTDPLESDELLIDAMIGLARAAALPAAEFQPLQAETFARNAVQKSIQLLGPIHTKTTTAHSALAVTLIAVGKNEEATTLLNSALGNLKASGEDNTIAYADLQLDLSSALGGSGDQATSIATCKSAITTLEALLPEDHPKVLRAKCRLALLLAHSSDWTAAQELLLKLHSAINPQNPAYRESCRFIATHLVQSGETDQVSQLCQNSFPDEVWLHIISDMPIAAADLVSQRLGNESDPRQRLHLIKRAASLYSWGQRTDRAADLLSESGELVEKARIPRIETFILLTKMYHLEREGKFAEVIELSKDPAWQHSDGQVASTMEIAWRDSMIAYANVQIDSANETDLKLAIDTFQRLNDQVAEIPDYMRWIIPQAAMHVVSIHESMGNAELAEQWRRTQQEATESIKSRTLADPWYRTLIDPDSNIVTISQQ